MKMRAAVLHGKDDLRMETIAVPEIGEDEILVKVKATGICGSDLPRVLAEKAHYYPIVLGHEFSGVVVDRGAQVKKVKVGDRVAGAPLIPCHRCADCQQGAYSQCRQYTFTGSRIQGSWAEYVKLPEINAVLLSDQVSDEEGAFFEPSAVALHALRHIQFQGGADVAVLGMGTIGMLTLQWAQILGAKSIAAFDIDQERLTLAQALGASQQYHTLDHDLREKLADLAPRGFDVVMETAGSTATMQLSFELAANQGDICFVGTPTKDLCFPYTLFEQMNRKEFHLTGSWMSYSAPFPGQEWQLTDHFLAKKQLYFSELIDKRLPLEEIAQAFEWYKQPGTIKGKVMLFPEWSA